MTSRIGAGFVLLAFAALTWLPQAQASSETANFDLSVTPRTTLSENAFSPVGIDFSFGTTSPDETIDPIKKAELTFPEIIFEENPDTPVCPDNLVGPPPVNLSAPIDQVVARCPDSVIGNGTADFLLGRNNINPNARITGQIVLFNGGEVNGKLLLKVYAYSYDTAVGLYAPVTSGGQTLTIPIPHIAQDSAVVDVDLAIPGRNRLVPLPNQGMEVELPKGVTDGVEVLAKCPQSNLNLFGELTIGRRDFSGQPIDGERVITGSKSISCSGLPDEEESDRKLTVQVTGDGSVSTSPEGINNCRATCEQSFAEGQRVTVTATPDQGSEFAGWGNTCSGDGPTCNIRLWNSTKVEATFVPLPPQPPDGPVGVSVNSGSQYTNDPQVQIDLIWPFGNWSALVSNDGGFQAAQAFDLEPSIPWTLDSSGPERLPKTVYVRFDSSSQTFSDDIILDETNPVVRSVRAEAKGSRTLLKVNAADSVSGVASIQAGPKKSTKITKIPYRSKLTIPGRAKRVWLRVSDRAGNNSKWISQTVKSR